MIILCLLIMQSLIFYLCHIDYDIDINIITMWFEYDLNSTLVGLLSKSIKVIFAYWINNNKENNVK